jgi:translation initiation factor IF-2
MTEKPKKKRVSTLAKSYEVPSAVLLKLLNDAGIDVKTASSMVDAETFLKVKPALVKEKEKLERKELVKAGEKIPMKAVLKKAPPVKPVEKKKEEPKPKATVVKTEPIVAKQEVKEDVAQPKGEAAEALEGLFKKTEEEQTATEVAEEQTPPATPTKKEEPSLKVVVEKPDDALAARVQKYMKDRAARKFEQKGMGGGNQGGYSGRFGKVSKGPNQNSRTGDTSEPRDVYAKRAQDAGVVNQAFGGPPKDKQGGGPKKGNDFQKKKSSKGRKKKTKEQIEQELSAMKSNVNKVMATVGRSAKKANYKKDREDSVETEEKKIIEVPEYISIAELAGLMNILPNQVIASCMGMGMMVTINQRLDPETIGIIADEFGYEVKMLDEYTEEFFEEEEEVAEEDLSPRAPIVTIMGHVDHGKTSLLDYIRKAKVADGEDGGITQHIGAYSVNTDAGPVTFLDTPGHEAFAAMRSRGAQVTDVIVLVVAADSTVMPQTREAIEHAKNAKVELIVAINKCDLPTANPDKIKAMLAEEGVQVEDWGGSVSCVEVSARTGHNMDKLLETLAIESEVLELKANASRRAKGTVIETRLDKGKGIVATVVVQDGTLKVGDSLICGPHYGKVRALLDDMGKRSKEAGPATPVQVLGLEGMPQAGDVLTVMESDREAKDVAARRGIAAKERGHRQKRHITLDQLHEQIESGEFHELKIIVKGDVDGSVEAIADSLDKLSTPEVQVNIISKGVGAVKEADIHLAAASNAMIIAFHLLPSEKIRNMAEEEGVSIENYQTIYKVVDDVQAAMEGMLSPDYKEEVCGEARILQLFKVPKVGTIAGCVVSSGYVDRESKVRLYRDGVEVGDAHVSSLKRLKDDVKSVKSGLECGIGVEGLKDIQVDDVLAFFKKVEVARKLSTASK